MCCLIWISPESRGSGLLQGLEGPNRANQSSNSAAFLPEEAGLSHIDLPGVTSDLRYLSEL
jgi:hypothetical protein